MQHTLLSVFIESQIVSNVANNPRMGLEKKQSSGPLLEQTWVYRANGAERKIPGWFND